MIQIEEKQDCCGCVACVQRCPKQCILLEEDMEGFLYPIVDKNLCIDCGLCEKVCPILNQNEPREPLKVYAAKNKDEKIRMKSSSGGIFTLLAEQTINEGGVVFGARFNEKWEVIHDYAETIEGLAPFRGSKYVQSRIQNTYQQAERFLKTGRKVLFSGAPCQIAGLKAFLQKEYENLLSLDFICHGVPSPKVWRMYLDEITAVSQKSSHQADLMSLKDSSIKIIDISFRDKKYGWENYHFAIHGELSYNGNDNKVVVSNLFTENPFMKGFLADLYLRPSCYACTVKNGKSAADITMGDFWGVSKILPQIYDELGISLLMLNTEHAIKVCLQLDLIAINVSYDDGVRFNTSHRECAKKKKIRNSFFANFLTAPNLLNLTIELSNKAQPNGILLFSKRTIGFLLKKSGLYIIYEIIKKKRWKLKRRK